MATTTAKSSNVKNSSNTAKVSEFVVNRSKRAKQLDSIHKSGRKMIDFMKTDKQAVKIVSREIASANKRYNTNFEVKMLTTKIYDLAPDFWLYGKKAHTKENKRTKWGFYWSLALIDKQVKKYAETRSKAAKVTTKKASKPKQVSRPKASKPKQQLKKVS